MQPNGNLVQDEARLAAPEEISLQLELHGKSEYEWLSARGWSGAKLLEIIRLRRDSRQEQLAGLEKQMEEARERSDVAKHSPSLLKPLRQPAQIRESAIPPNQRLRMKFKGDFRRARREICDLAHQICALSGPPYPNWWLEKRVKPSPAVDDLVNRIGGMGMGDTTMSE
ncbi:hypothetical protein V5O48_018739 [Marasmius crinis-equi]|uniref:Uncharacterized protein n=1 Tax=Marasmius crinis-equi TaxID=585013 RepID=A0ABR3EKE7_9AGAR